MTLSQCFKLFKFSYTFKSSLPNTFGLTKNYNTILSHKISRNQCENVEQQVVKDISQNNNVKTKEIFDKINDQIQNKTCGRLFAVIHLQNLQYKVTTEDIIVVRFPWPPTSGDKIRLEKVLLVGSKDFTLIGRPLLPLHQVAVYGIVIEKTLSHPIPRFRYRPRSNYMKLTFTKDELTYLRITDIILNGNINELRNTDGLENKLL